MKPPELNCSDGFSYLLYRALVLAFCQDCYATPLGGAILRSTTRCSMCRFSHLDAFKQRPVSRNSVYGNIIRPAAPMTQASTMSSLNFSKTVCPLNLPAFATFVTHGNSGCIVLTIKPTLSFVEVVLSL